LFSSRRRHTILVSDWSSDVCSSDLDLSKGQQRTPAYLALNPTGRTPTLVDGDLMLWESTAIMQYLADRKPNALWPNDMRARCDRSEERRVGKEGGAQRAPYHGR